MIYQLKTEYQEPILTTEFSLDDNYFDNNWINGLLIKPVVEDVHLLDANNNLLKKDLWISFNVFSYDKKKTKEKDFYSEMHKDMKIFVKQEWSFFTNPYPIYSIHKIKNGDDNKVDYLCLYISPKKTINTFDFSVIYNQDYLLKTYFELLFRSMYINDIKGHTAIADIHSGNILLNPVVKNDYVSAYKVNIEYKLNKLNFELELKRYHLDNNSITLADDICFNNKRYGRKVDARKLKSHSRKFLSFEHYESLNDSKFINQIKVFEKFEELFKNFKIIYKAKTFEPKYLINDFSSLKTLNRLNVWVEDTDMSKFKIMFPNKENFINYLNLNYDEKQNHIIDVEIMSAKNIMGLIENKDMPNLYIMFSREREAKGLDKDNEEDEMCVTEIVNGKEKLFDSVLEIFLERKLFDLSEVDFIKAIENFDLYSQVKLYNLFLHKNKLGNIVSQGLIIDYLPEINNETVLEEGKKKKKSVKLKHKQKVIKSINDLSIKYNLFTKREFDLPLNVFEIKIIEKEVKGKSLIYSYIFLKRDGNNLFKVMNKEIFINEEINNIDCDIDIISSFENNNLCIILDDEYLIKYKNKMFPSLVVRNDIYLSKDNPVSQINERRIKGDSLNKLSKTSTSFTFFPYIHRTAAEMIIEKANQSKTGHGFCMFNINDNELYSFVNASINSANKEILKQTRLETMILQKKDGLFYEDVNWDENKDIMNGILSTKTIKQLINNSVSKQSILNKLTNILIHN